MKNKLFILVATALLLAGMVVNDAGAGIFGNKEKDAERELKTWRYDRMPTMGFASGRIVKDTLTEWKIGDKQVVFSPTCTVIGAGGEATKIREGSEVIVMGARAGNTIVAWQVRVMKPDYLMDVGTKRSTVNWSEVDPDVGEGTGRSPM